MKPLIAQQDGTEALVAELHRLGLRHLARLDTRSAYPAMPPQQLVAQLAAHPQARLRGALILLFLRHPALSARVPEVLPGLADPSADTLRLYYQAALYLQSELEPLLRQSITGWQPLPDLFSAELGLPPGATLGADAARVDAALIALGNIHQRLSGQAYNWAGSYRQHMPLFLKHLQRTRGIINA